MTPDMFGDSTRHGVRERPARTAAPLRLQEPGVVDQRTSDIPRRPDPVTQAVGLRRVLPRRATPAQIRIRHVARGVLLGELRDLALVLALDETHELAAEDQKVGEGT